MQLSFQLVLCSVGAQSVFSWEPGLSVVSLLHVHWIFFLFFKDFLSFRTVTLVFCNCVFSVKGQVACQFTLIFWWILSNMPNGFLLVFFF